MESGNSLDLERIFISYSSRGDGCKWRDALLGSLHVFEQHNLLDAWYDERILASSNWHKAIEDAMSSARVAVLLLTPEALQTEYILEVEFPFLEKRWRNGELLVFSIICEPCSWEKHPWLKEVQAFYRATPLSKLSFEKQQLCFRQIAVDISTQLSNIVLAALPQPERLPASDQIFLQKFPLSRGPGLLEEKLIGREQELALLDLAFAQPDTTIASLVAWGGVGKTMLVQEWLKKLERKDWFGVKRIYGWSFYSQGTNEDRQASEDTFFAHALEWFGVQCEPTVSPWEKGRLLAEAINSQKSILILDGVEPLQYPPGPMGGQFRAPGIQALLKYLARKSKRERSASGSLILVTTREPLTDLAGFQIREDSLRGSLLHLDLPNLTEEAGASLLHHVGVNRVGAADIDPDHEELLRASKEVKGHALTLHLLGRFLNRLHEGDILRRDLVKLVEADQEILGGTTFKILAAFERWFAKEREFGVWQHAILRMLAFFDRPAAANDLSVLRRPPAIDGLTSSLFSKHFLFFRLVERSKPLSEDGWNYAISFLLDFGLVSIQMDNDGHQLNCHPLIREYFKKQLQSQFPKAWATAHERLFRYLCSTKSDKKRNPTIEELQPLYHAVTHGCYAGLTREALDDVFSARICKMNQNYHIWRLGAHDSNLKAISSFFEKPWSQVSQNLPRSHRALLFGDAGDALQALGRLQEAIDPMQASLENYVDIGRWYDAAIAAFTISNLQTTLGNLEVSLKYAAQAVTYADRSYAGTNQTGTLNYAELRFKQIAARTAYAEALYKAGWATEADDFFRESEKMLIERNKELNQKAPPKLQSYMGFQYCELLLGAAERGAWRIMLGLEPEESEHTLTSITNEVAIRASQTLAWNQELDSRQRKGQKVHFSLLDTALDNLTIGRTALYDAIIWQASNGDYHKPIKIANLKLKAAMEYLRGTGQQDELPRAFLSRAWFRIIEGDWEGAREDLDDAWDIADRGPMCLYQTEIHLYRARLFWRDKSYPWTSPQDDLTKARLLIEKSHYVQREGELIDAEKAILGNTPSGTKKIPRVSKAAMHLTSRHTFFPFSDSSM